MLPSLSPVTVFAFACAIHLTDVRPAIVRGLRGLLLLLLSWILPLAVIIVGGFLFSLPATGLEPLWSTRHAGALLLGTTAVLVVLINAAFQSGTEVSSVPRILRYSARVACFMPLPLVVLAIYALSLRVGDYGWTNERIIAASCLLVASCYAAGYAWAALQQQNWLAALAPVNITTAFVILALLLLLFSPLLDPARLAVAHQVARLESGKQSAEKFDYNFLRNHGGRYGLAALERLKTQTAGKDAAVIRAAATLALQKKSSPEKVVPSHQDIASNLRMWPPTESIPATFIQQKWQAEPKSWQLPLCLTQKNHPCDVHSIDFDGDGKQELLLLRAEGHSNGAVIFQHQADGWKMTAQLAESFARCGLLRERLKAGDFRLTTPQYKNLVIAGETIVVYPQELTGVKCKS